KGDRETHPVRNESSRAFRRGKPRFEGSRLARLELLELLARAGGQWMSDLFVGLRPAGKELPFPRDVRLRRGERLRVLLGAARPGPLERTCGPLVLEEAQGERLEERVVEAGSEAGLAVGDVRRDREGSFHHEGERPGILPIPLKRRVELLDGFRQASL